MTPPSSQTFRDRPMPPRVRQIVTEVAAKHGFAPAMLLGYDGRRMVVRARYEAYARIVAEVVINHARPSLPLIGSWMARDHTAILYALRRHASDYTWTRSRPADEALKAAEAVAA